MPPILLLRRVRILRCLSRCGAFSEETARTLADAGVFHPNAFPRFTAHLVARRALGQTADHAYYVIQ